jgi:hypothetical protein
MALAAQRGNAEDLGRGCSGVDRHGAAEGVSHQDDPRDAEGADERGSRERVLDARVHVRGPAVIDLERRDAFGLELARQTLVQAAGGAAESAASSKDPDDAGIAGRGAVEAAANARKCEIFRVPGRDGHTRSVAHRGPQ